MLFPTCDRLARGGWAVAQVNNEGEEEKAIYGTLPGALPCNASVAEHYPVAYLADAIGEGSRCFFDCAAVLANLRGGAGRRHPRRKMAGYAREFHTRCRQKPATEKVKAHLKLEDAQNDRETWLIKSNAVADNLAKEGAWLQAPSAAEIKIYNDHLEKWRAVAFHMARVLAKWPTARALFGDLEKAPRDPRGPRRRK